MKFIAQLLINDARRWNSQGKLCGKRAIFASRGDNEALRDMNAAEFVTLIVDVVAIITKRILRIC